MRFLAALCVSLVLTGCGGPSVPNEQGGGAVLVEARPGEMRSPGWLEFQDLSLHFDSEPATPHEPFIRGWILGGLFVPTGDVQGVVSEIPARRVLESGWLELKTRAFTPEKALLPKVAPYVLGQRDLDTGGFFPTSGVQLAVDPGG